MAINGSPGNDIIPGTSAADIINALGGNDYITPGNGSDTVDAGAGNDTVFAGNGDDTVDGGLGNDKLSGGNGSDTLNGGEGNDTLDGGNGNDVMNGGVGNDSLAGGNGDDVMDGGAGSDNLAGGNGRDTLVYVLAENGGSSDIYQGGSGNDTLRIVLTGAEWAQVDVRADLLRFLDALHGGDKTPFQFTAFGLKTSGFENIEVVVDGVPVVLADHAVDAVDDTFSVDENSSLAANVTGNDSMPALVAVSLVQDVTQGDLTLNGDGSFVFDTNGQFDYLAVGDSATQTFQYQVMGSNGDTDVATASITIEGVNDSPDANDDIAIVSEDGPAIIINLLANDTDPDAGDTLSVTSFDFSLLQGSVVDNGDGTVTYDPNGAYGGLNDFELLIDSFNYTISDGNGGTSTAAVYIAVEGHDEAAARVGYYDMSTGQGGDYMVNEIELAGHQAVNITDLSAADLVGIDVLNVYNPDNNGFGTEFTANLANVFEAVEHGMMLIIHDREVGNAETILPGGGAFNIIRDFGDSVDIDLLPDAIGRIDNGPGGALTDFTLDGGNHSNHGFTVEGSLPAGADLLLARGGNDGDIVTFGYDYGEGHVIYSSIPLDFYSGGQGFGLELSQGEAEAYAANVIDYGAKQAFDLV